MCMSLRKKRRRGMLEEYALGMNLGVGLHSTRDPKPQWDHQKMIESEQPEDSVVP
jgi:hypothetical protein